LRLQAKQAAIDIYRPRPKISIYKWAADNVDFSREPTYDTPLKGPFDPDLMPFYKEPLDKILEGDCREIWFRAAERLGKTEHLILMPMRYSVAVDPMPSLYLSSDQKSSEKIFETRVKLGMYLAEATAEKYESARAIEHEIYFPNMYLVATWPRAKGAFKQTGYQRVYTDEASLLPDNTAGAIRKRTDTYPNSTIIFCSAPDATQNRPSEKDPIYYELDDTPQKIWSMPDPKTRRLFTFRMGEKLSPDGLKWEQKAYNKKKRVWDLERVARSAHYVTPDGTVIGNEKRNALIAKGKWIAENRTGLTPGKEGYIANAFLSPFPAGDFGELAVGFLTARRQGGAALKQWIYSNMPDQPWSIGVERAADNVITLREGPYRAGEKMSECKALQSFYIKRRSAVILTQDVQQTHIWAVAREWIKGGDSGLLWWKPIVMWSEIELAIQTWRPRIKMIDNSYTRRRLEVLDKCVAYKMIPTYGRDQLKEAAYIKRKVDPFEGTRKQGRHTIDSYTFNPNAIKNDLWPMIHGRGPRRWTVYDEIESEYCDQMTSENNHEGQFVLRRAGVPNHIWDCEVLQVLAARILGFAQHIEPSQADSEPAPKRPRATTGEEREARPPAEKPVAAMPGRCPKCRGSSRKFTQHWECRDCGLAIKTEKYAVKERGWDEVD